MNEPAKCPSTTGVGPEKYAAMRLSMTPGVGPRLYHQLVGELGSAQAVLDAGPSRLAEVVGIGNKLVRAISVESQQINVDEEIERCLANEIELIDSSEPSYPGSLREIYDPPPILYRQGKWTPVNEIAIAIVGTRHASRYGLRQAEKLATGLANAGVTVISGLARGVDAAAHRAALNAGGETIAVLGGGILELYPPEHKDLAMDITRQGCLFSEMPTLNVPRSTSFPRRNRIISGISLGVLVIEAADRSGSLITARHAMDQNREVFALPGSVENRASKGCHRLIRDGATLVETVDDILDQLGPLAKPVQANESTSLRNAAEVKLDEQQRAILDLIETEPTSIDSIVDKSGIPVSRVLATISILEMRRLIRRISGSLVERI